MPKVINLTIPSYTFNQSENPYAFDNESPKSLKGVAQKIEKSIEDNFGHTTLLIRGVQAGHHRDISKNDLVRLITKNGRDVYGDGGSVSSFIYAAPFEEGAILEILSGFHTYKPKCEEIPQNPVDIWMIFDLNSYKNIEYIHPRHNIVAKDCWEPKTKGDWGLLGVVVISSD